MKSSETETLDPDPIEICNAAIGIAFGASGESLTAFFKHAEG